MAVVEAPRSGEPGSAGAPTGLALVLLAAAWALALGALSTASPRVAVVSLGALAGLVGLGCLLVVGARAVAPLATVAFFLLLTVPVDKYFDYQAHVGGWPGLRVSVADLTLLVLLPVACVSWLIGQGRRALPGVFVALIALQLALYGVSLLHSPRRDLSFFEVVSTLHSLLLCWVVATVFRRRVLEAILLALALQVLVHSAVAGLQVATGRAIGAGLFGGREQVLNEGLTSGVSLLRPSGLFVHPIVFADFLFLSLPLVAAGVALARGRAMRALMGAALLAGLAGLALTLSRGAWLAGLLTAAIFLTATRRRGLLSRVALRRTLLAAALVAAIGAAAFGPRIYDRLTESHAGNLDVRFELNWIALRMIAARPFAGQGLNVFTEVMARFDPKDVMAYFPAPAHNLYLLEAAEVGLPGMLLLIAVFVCVPVCAARRVGRLRDPALQWVAIAVAAGFVGLMFSQLADFSYRLEPLRSFVWALIGLLFGVLRPTAPEGRRSAPSPAHGDAS